METEIEKLIDVVILFVDDQPKGLMKEMELTKYRGKVWWDYLERYSISNQDYEKSDVHSIYWTYTHK